MTEEDYILQLEEKLDEELAERHQSRNIEELADLLEVIRAVAVANGCIIEELEQIQAEEAQNRDGFDRRILLKEVIE